MEKKHFPKIVIGVPTFKRPEGLNRLLNSLARLKVKDLSISILVADNDKLSQQGIELVNQLPEFRFPIQSVLVPEQGISFVRNKLLQVAFEDLQADFLAMVDDDEWVEENWLQALYDTHSLTQCDVIGGNVLTEFEVEPPQWARQTAIYCPIAPIKSGEVDLIEGTGSVLLHKKVYFDFKQQRFDTFYSIYGGGDKEYFTRLKKQNARFAVAHQAISYEVFPESRVNKKWVLERAHRVGGAEMRIVLMHHFSYHRLLQECFKLTAALSVGLFKLMTSKGSTQRRINSRILIARQIGKVGGLFKRHKAVYKVQKEQ